MTKGRQVDRPEGNHISVKSGYSANTRQPYVELYLGDQMVQLTLLEAREIAKYLLEAAEDAEAAGVLVEFREFREQQRAQQREWEYPGE